jgi:hypothetical protein
MLSVTGTTTGFLGKRSSTGGSVPALTRSASIGASLYFGAAVTTGTTGASVVVGNRTGMEVAGLVGATGTGVAFGVHAERIVERTRIQANAIVRVVLVLDGFICILLLTKSGSIFGNETPF